MGHSVGRAAENATAKSFAKVKAERTTEQIISDIRKNIEAKLAVTPGDTQILLQQYDYAAAEGGSLRETVTSLTEEVTKLRLANNIDEYQTEAGS